jgi:Skp family chaperone for outer membrane proteins
MPLQLVLDSIDNVPEALRGEYTERDGKFHLNVDGIEDTSGLKKALETERKAAKDLERKVKRWEAIGKSDEEISQMLRDQEEAERKKAEAAGDHAKILKQHQDKWEKEKASLEAELNATRASERHAIISTSIMTALTKANASEEGIDLLPDRLAARIKFETVDGARVVKITQADGETPMAGSGKDGAATFDDLVKEASSKWPSLFKGSGRTGSGMSPNGAGGSGKKSMSRTEFEKLPPMDRAGVLRGGVTLTD